MNILIDIGHPGHVHLFRNLYKEFVLKHKVFTTVKSNLQTAIQLLEHYDMPFIKIGEKADGIISKAFNQLKYNKFVYDLVKKENINVGIGTSITIPHVSRLTKMASIVLDDDDDEVQPLFVKFAHPFADMLLSPEALKEHRKRNDTVYYAGYHELAYLHPNRFSPDVNILKNSGIEKDEKYFVLRFNSLKAHHDLGARGLSFENKRKIIEILKPYGRIFITTEREIESEFQRYQIRIKPHEIHSFLYYAEMFIGDSQTMTSEAAILGTPAFKCNSFAAKLSVPNELERKYNICYSFLPIGFEDMLGKIKTTVSMKNMKMVWRKRVDRLLGERIDVTAFLVWFVENYPESYRRMNEKPEIQYTFK